MISSVPSKNYLFKVSYSRTRIWCENCWGLSMETIVSLQCLHCWLLTYFQHALIVDFEQVNVCRVHIGKISTFEGCIMRYAVVYWNLFKQIAFELISSQPHGWISEKYLRRSLLQTLILAKTMRLILKMTWCTFVLFVKLIRSYST